MKCSAIQRENVNRGHARCIQYYNPTNVQNDVPLNYIYMDTSPEISSPFINRLIDNCLLGYTTEQTALRRTSLSSFALGMWILM